MVHHVAFQFSTIRCAQDWEFLFDLGEGLVFPPEIAATNQRPDIVIFSRSLRQVILIELTVPLEDRVSDAHSRKHDRYLPLLVNCESNGWHATHFPVEVGCRGFVAFSLTRCLKDSWLSHVLGKACPQRMQPSCRVTALQLFAVPEAIYT